jgi:hypothetical protein
VSDRIAAAYLADLLQREGIAARVGRDLGAVMPAGEARAIDAVCVTYIDTRAAAQARYLVRRLRRGLPGKKIVAVLLSQPDGESRERLESVRADGIAGSLRRAVEEVRDIIGGATPARPAAGARAVAEPVPVAGN